MENRHLTPSIFSLPPRDATYAPPLVGPNSSQFSSISQLENNEARRVAGPGQGHTRADTSQVLGSGHVAGTVLGNLGEEAVGYCHLYSIPKDTKAQREVTNPRPHIQRGHAEIGTQA